MVWQCLIPKTEIGSNITWMSGGKSVVCFPSPMDYCHLGWGWDQCSNIHPDWFAFSNIALVRKMVRNLEN